MIVMEDYTYSFMKYFHFCSVRMHLNQCLLLIVPINLTSLPLELTEEALILGVRKIHFDI